MTDNISRMYELAGIDRFDYELAKYPYFTDTKQLELIKWLTTNWGSFVLYKNEDGFLCGCHSFSSCFCKKPEEALALLVCRLWEDLIDSQKEEIKRILK